MNIEEIIKIAREAGFKVDWQHADVAEIKAQRYVAFANAVIKARDAKLQAQSEPVLEVIAELETLNLGLQNSNGHLRYRIAELEAQNKVLLDALKVADKALRWVETTAASRAWDIVRAAIAQVEGKQ